VLIHIRGFGGEIPRTSSRLLADNLASAALNAKLWSGEIRPFYNHLQISDLAKAEDLQRIYLYQDKYWCHWPEAVSVVRGPVAGDTKERTYFSDPANGAKVFNSDLVAQGGGLAYPVASYKLGVPAPVNDAVANPFTAAATDSGGSGNDRDVVYIYTYVSAWGEEGGPSSPTTTVTAKSGEKTQLTNITPCPTDDYPNLEKIRIYRSHTGNTYSQYLFVDEIDGASTSYDDTVEDSALAEECPSLGYLPPPDNLDGLVAHPSGFLVGYAGNILYCSVPYYPHAWPVANQYTLKADITALGIYDQTIVVFTRGYPYILSGTSPDQLRQEQLPNRMPCISKRGVVSCEYGVLAPTPDGIYLIGSAGTSLVTKDSITRSEWYGFNPETLHSEVADGKYYGFYLTKVVDGVKYGRGFSFDVSSPASSFVEFDFYAHALYVDPATDNLFFADKVDGKNVIKKWEGGGTRATYVWRSKAFGQQPLNPAAAQVVANYEPPMSAEEVENMQAARQDLIDANQVLIDTDKANGYFGGFECGVLEFGGSTLSPLGAVYIDEPFLNIKIYADGDLKFQKALTGSEPFRLPSGYRTRELEIELEGNVNVKNVSVASSVTEIYKAGY